MPRTPPVTEGDESYSHQLVAPKHVTQHEHPNWQERCYHLLFTESGLVLDTGRAIWPVEGRRKAFAGATDGKVQYCVRNEEPFGLGDNPDHSTIGGSGGAITVEAIRPMREIHLTHGAEGDPFAFDLTFEGRFQPVATSPHEVVQNDEIVTHYMNFFQSGYYDGWISHGGERHEVVRRLGFRDRGWGLRKHEGSPRRGLVLSIFCELPEESLYVILFETASGRRVLTNGWSISEAGVVEVASVEHDVVFDGTVMNTGTAHLELDDGTSREIKFTKRTHLFLAGVGYSPDRELTAPGTDTYDVSQPDVAALLSGQTDHGCDFEVEGVAGNGYVETGLGAHARYRPQQKEEEQR